MEEKAFKKEKTKRKKKKRLVMSSLMHFTEINDLLAYFVNINSFYF